MTIRNLLRSKLFSILAGETVQRVRRSVAEQRRKLGQKPHVVAVFLELDDPWSYLLAHYLPELAASYDIQLHYHLVQARTDEAYRPAAEMLARYADEDCARLAAELGVPFLDRGAAPPVEHRRALIDGLARVAGKPEFDSELLDALASYWRGDTESIARRVGDATGEGEAMLARNQRKLTRLGHYNSAMLHYGREWYWGVDRLHYLTSRLDALGVKRTGEPAAKIASIRQVMNTTLPVKPPSAASDLAPLELFYSFRSPYSYVGLNRVFKLADAFGLRLDMRPVLPMVMRGMRVPREKAAYIIMDTSREARRLQVSFGRFADPVGAGIERCLAVFYYARGERRERDFARHAGEAIWSRGIDLATDAGMRKVTGRCGLFWPDVVAAMNNEDWRQSVEENREAMFDLGCWGVPTLRLGDFVTWGQDRIWLMARHVEELCDAGEGILI